MSYHDLINIDDFAKKKETFNSERWDVSFYCKECKKIVNVDRPNKKWYTFICKECKSKNIAVWTEEGLKINYRIK
mgnify:CR=1 FL=1